MNDHFFLSDNGLYEISLPGNLLNKMYSLCDRHEELETGGLLIGYYCYGGNMARVTEIVGPPTDSTFKAAWFQRGISGLKQTLKERWNAKKRTYYLGEWHYHPAECPYPSGQDLQSMIKIAGDPAYQCQNPILVIVSRETATYSKVTKTWVFDKSGIHHEGVSKYPVIKTRG